MEGLASLRFEALGSECELYAIGSDEPLERTAEWIHELHRRLTRFEPGSELSRFNARAGEWVEVSPELRDLLDAALDACGMSDGVVHAGVLPALIEAGYDRTFDEITEPSQAALPSSRTPADLHQFDADLHQIDARPHAWSKDPGRPAETATIGARRARRQRASGPVAPLGDLLDVRGSQARLAPGAAVDLGGLAKGWIADRAVERLGPNSLANCGGDLRAVGGGPTGEGWPVGFGGKTLLLEDLGAATSGTARRRWGDGLHHLIDPRTGAPAITDLTEVSVLAPTALEAEILAKTALLLGSVLAPRALEGRASGWALS